MTLSKEAGREDRPRPSAQATTAAENAARVLRNSSLKLRREFIRHGAEGRQLRLVNPEADDPPLARFIRGGQAGGRDSVRLKLYLSLLWHSPGRGEGTGLPPHSTTLPAVFWAELLDLDDATGRGKRRISEALQWLQQQRFITLTYRSGDIPIVTVLRETGHGEEYRLPVYPDSEGRRHGFVSVPADFWKKGWLAALSGPALAVYLALLDAPRDQNFAEVWLSPRLKERYAISEDTWRKGKRELAQHGLIEVRRGAKRNPGSPQAPIYRDLYTLHFSERLRDYPGSDPLLAQLEAHLEAHLEKGEL